MQRESYGIEWASEMLAKAAGLGHKNLVMKSRVRILAHHLSNLIPETEALKGLDVGCGGGEIAHLIGKTRPNIHLQGIEVLLRPHSQISVQQFDGITLPFPNQFFDFVMLIDVLHHASDRERLLSECVRVSQKFLLIKDHINHSGLDELRLRFMDWVGNRAYGVSLPYQYLSEQEWQQFYQIQGLIPAITLNRLNLYPLPFRLIFDAHLHFISRLNISANLS